MSYSNFDLDTVKTRFRLELVREREMFSETEEIDPSHLLQETLKENVPLALAIHTEKARSELIVAPILVEVRRRLDHKISLFSGTEFNVDRERDLNGVCDFIVSLSSEQLTITSPIISIVEAKNDNVKSGIPQCIAEMVAAQLFNEKEGIPIETVYGVVTTGSNWLFMKLSGHRVEINLNEYYLVQLDKIIGILISVIEDAFAKQK
jgi:hypothetical protein